MRATMPCLHGHGHGGTVACAVAACLALVTFLVVILDPRTQASSWFLPSSSFSPGVLSSLRPTATGSNGAGAAGGGPLLVTSTDGAGGGSVAKNSTGNEVLFTRGGGRDPLALSFVNADSGDVDDVSPHVSVAPAPSPATVRISD